MLHSVTAHNVSASIRVPCTLDTCLRRLRLEMSAAPKHTSFSDVLSIGCLRTGDALARCKFAAFALRCNPGAYRLSLTNPAFWHQMLAALPC